MGAPKNNDFWKKRYKHGRDKLFATPDSLLDGAYQYFKWVKKNPLYESVVSGGKVLTLPKMRAMTIEGMCIFLGIDSRTFWNYCDESNKNYKDFIPITTHIKEIIRTQKFEGAAAGFLNANIIARDLGLKEKTETETTHKGSIELHNLSTEELVKRAKAVKNLDNDQA